MWIGVGTGERAKNTLLSVAEEKLLENRRSRSMTWNLLFVERDTWQCRASKPNHKVNRIQLLIMFVQVERSRLPVSVCACAKRNRLGMSAVSATCYHWLWHKSWLLFSFYCFSRNLFSIHFLCAGFGFQLIKLTDFGIGRTASTTQIYSQTICKQKYQKYWKDARLYF